MHYIPTIWVNEVTPVNAENLNKIEQGLATMSELACPAVTTESNGAFLRVVNGSWAAVQLTDVSVEGA
jgi:hypothetical protein